MAIMFRCKKCSTKIKVPNDKAGKHGKCPKCSYTVLVPLKTEPEFGNLNEQDTRLIRKRAKPGTVSKNTSRKHRMSKTGDAQTKLGNQQKVAPQMRSYEEIDLEQTAMLHLPESEMNEPIGRKRKTFKMQSKQADIGEDDDLLFLDEEKPDLIDDTALVDIPEEPAARIPDDYFAGLDVDTHENEKTEIVEKQIKPIVKSRSVKQSIPATRPRKRPQVSPKPKSRISEYKSSKQQSEGLKIEEPAKKGGGGFFWVFFGIILALVHTAAAFILGASFMLNRIEKGASIIDPAFNIMKFDNRLNKLDQNLKANELESASNDKSTNGENENSQ